MHDELDSLSVEMWVQIAHQDSCFDVELKNLLWKFCRFERVQDDSTGGGRLRPFLLHFDHCLLYHLDEVYIILNFLFVLVRSTSET